MFGYSRGVERHSDRGIMRMRSRTSEQNVSDETSRLLDTQNPTNNLNYSEQNPNLVTHRPGGDESRHGIDVEEEADNGDDQRSDAGSPSRDPDTQLEEEMTDQITTITNRLRILFYTLYIPVIPLLTLLVFLLAELISKAAKSPPCSHPLRFYSYISLILFIYLPNHKRIKRWFFNYNRERNQTRPRAERTYDQWFHILICFYIYYDMSLVQNCKEDLDPSGSGQSTCMITCPELYQSFERFDLILRIFGGVLVLPMICLPFAYLWLIRRISTVDTDALVRLGVQLGADQDDLAGGAKVKEILDGLRDVKLEGGDIHLNNSEGDQKVRVVGLNKESWSGDNLKDWRTVKDCCICMCEFECVGIERVDDDIEAAEPRNEDAIVETKCGHLFHKNCIGSWIGGHRWEEADANSRARRRNCPLCREDLIINGANVV